MSDLSKLRNGNFTASNAYRLCGSLKSGEPTEAFFTYAKEKMFERKLGRSLEVGAHSNSMVWGSFLEKEFSIIYLPLIKWCIKKHFRTQSIHF